MPFIACLLLLIYGFINIFAILYYTINISVEMEEDEAPIYTAAIIFYKNLWNELRFSLNIPGSIIIAILVHILTLPALIILTLIIYLIMIPSIYIVKLFCYLFRNKENMSEGPGIEW